MEQLLEQYTEFIRSVAIDVNDIKDDAEYLEGVSFVQKLAANRNKIIKSMGIEANNLYLCQCGETNNFPFCDGSHAN